MGSTKPKYTPGPWTFDEHGGNFYVWGAGSAMVADNDDEDGFVPPEVIARMRGTGRGATDEEKRANARLIASAPKLLEACCKTLFFLQSVRVSDPLDPLQAIQDRVHGPIRKRLEDAIAVAFEETGE